MDNTAFEYDSSDVKRREVKQSSCKAYQLYHFFSRKDLQVFVIKTSQLRREKKKNFKFTRMFFLFHSHFCYFLLLLSPWESFNHQSTKLIILAPGLWLLSISVWFSPACLFQASSSSFWKSNGLLSPASFAIPPTWQHSSIQNFIHLYLLHSFSDWELHPYGLQSVHI